MKDFRKLHVWEKAHLLTLEIYKTTRTFPKDALFGLTSQSRRASASIPANIAEGCGREGETEMGRFFQIAQGSASELEYHLLLAHGLKFIATAEYTSLSNQTVEVRRMFTTLIKKPKSG